ncbi:hypothetical protein MRB53_020023 [Persea americana]|uniref:Uncharacterized protein n=1 Tax=Persea americana TaxID=3435 RepID=A0ACC2KZZ2_PERAE|nr:hypothetical protein MRB53_020023 [Persea americana]
MVWLELQSEAVVTRILHLAAVAQKSPFQVLQRWMEVLGSPPCEVWIRLKGVPLHVWRAETFSLLGEYLGSMLEVDPDVELEREEKIGVLNDGAYATKRLIVDSRVVSTKFTITSSCRSSSGSGLAEEDDDSTDGVSNSNRPPSQHI